MFFLKYSCPFGGKTYPGIIAMIVALIALMGTTFSGSSAFVVILASVGMPLVVLGVFFWLEHLPTDEERRVIESTELPLWMPATPDLIEGVRARKGKFTSRMLTIMMIGAIFMIAFITPKHGDPDFKAMITVGIITAVVILFDYLMRSRWNYIDESAVYTTVPIDHMYSVTHRGKYGRTWEESYIVFYLPDGKYIVHAESGDGSARAITLVRFQGMVMWLPFYGDREDF